MPDSMLAAVADAPQSIRTERRPRPEPGPGEIRIRVLACGICGSDLHFHQLGLYPRGVVPGHEVAGEVDAVGAGVATPQVGDRVAVEPLAACGECDACRSGRGAICPQGQLFGIHRDGGLAEALVIPAERAFPVPADLDPRIAALAEPLAVAVHGLRRAGFAADQRVLVLGAGSIGLLTAFAAAGLGAGAVWISARHAHQADLARALGAHRALPESDVDADGLRRLGGEAPFDCVVETVGGRADTLQHAAWALRPGGVVSVLGVFTGAVAVDPFPLLLREGTLAWSNCYQRAPGRPDFAVAIDRLDAERERLAPLTTHTIPLDRAPEAFTVAADKKIGAIKVSVVPTPP